MATAINNQILALLALDTDANRLAVKYCGCAKPLFPTVESQKKFEKKIVAKLPKPSGGAPSGDVDVVLLVWTVLLFNSAESREFILSTSK